MLINDMQMEYLKMIFRKREIKMEVINVEYRGVKSGRHFYLILLPDNNIVITTPKLYMVADIQKAVRALVNPEYEQR